MVISQRSRSIRKFSLISVMFLNAYDNVISGKSVFLSQKNGTVSRFMPRIPVFTALYMDLQIDFPVRLLSSNAKGKLILSSETLLSKL